MNHSDFIMVLGLIVVVALLALCYAGYLFSRIKKNHLEMS